MTLQSFDREVLANRWQPIAGDDLNTKGQKPRAKWIVIAVGTMLNLYILGGGAFWVAYSALRFDIAERPDRIDITSATWLGAIGLCFVIVASAILGYLLGVGVAELRNGLMRKPQATV
jgi:hypothetical protein